MKKTLVVGLDAACWEFLEPLLQAGRLPAIQQLIDTGIRGVLHSTMPAHTPTAWSSIVTGKNPGKHGIYDHIQPRPGTNAFSPPSAHTRLGTPFWRRLNECGLRVGLVNVPFTHPPEPMDGFVVGGFGTPRSVPDITYPRDDLAWIEERLGRYEPSVDPKLLRHSSSAELLDAESKHQSQQVQIAIELVAKYQVHVLAINLMLLDHANHRIPEMAQIEEAICQCDRDLEMLLRTFQPDNVMLFSDHGSRRVEGTFLLHAWLRDQGYAVQARRLPSERADAFNWLLTQWLGARWGETKLRRRKVLRNLTGIAVLRLPESATQIFWDKVEKSIPFAREYVFLSEQMDYERTRVYLGASYSGLLYFNRINREPSGIVSPEERRELAAELAQKLAQIPDPNADRPLITNVYRAKEIYEGPTLEYAPDLILDTYDASCNVLTNFRRGSEVEKRQGRYFVADKKEFGRHTRDGMFIFAGQDFDCGVASRQGHVMDIPATLLHLYNVPVPEDYDGQPLTEFMAPEFVSQHPIIYQQGDSNSSISSEHLYSPKEMEELLVHLKALGYVE